jgi:uncharacterized RmlC-like cupin family protein
VKSMTIVRRQSGLFAPSEQGQRLRSVVDGGSAPGTPMCVVELEMPPGTVSWPHLHREVTPLIHLEEGDGEGVTTFLGWELEEMVTIRPGEYGVIRPGVPHVAVYPRRSADQVWARGTETRDHPDPQYDNVRLPQLWGLVVQRLCDLEWDVDFPADRPSMVGGRRR